MAGKGGRTSTTWKKGQNPVKKPGQKHKRTILKESLGFNNWDRLVSFVNHEGAEKLVDEIMNLKGKDFVFAMAQITEFVKPKLQRTTVEGNPQKPFTFLALMDGLPIEIRKTLLLHMREKVKLLSNGNDAA